MPLRPRDLSNAIERDAAAAEALAERIALVDFEYLSEAQREHLFHWWDDRARLYRARADAVRR
jgi:hypothetical protein